MKLFTLTVASILALSLLIYSDDSVDNSEFKESFLNNLIIKNLLANDKEHGKTICKDFPYCKLDIDNDETGEIKALNRYLMRA